MTDPLDILICGDICPTQDTRALFDTGDPAVLMGVLASRIKDADIAIANLECVLSDNAGAADKIGPVLVGRPADAQLLAAAGFDLLGAANNHIGDCGAQGVMDTLAACKNAGLLTTGAGSNAQSAAKPAIIRHQGWQIGVMAVAEHEFNAAGPSQAGAHIFDPLQDLERLAALKAECDYVIVLYHGGIEYYSYPSPMLARTCRALVRNGADLVLCQHSHVIGTFEEYQGGHIVYGQGNAVYGYRNKESWNTGLAVTVQLVKADASSNPEARIELVPIGCDQSGRVDLLPPETAEPCLKALQERSQKALDPKGLEDSWARFCDGLGRNQLPHLLGLGLWMTRANRLFRGAMVRLLFSRRQRMISMNVLRCDSHREVILTAFAGSLASVKKDENQS
jgi:poly-gamma-glutamate capsule biosynthesis protein CapA/YwtB (metallophosphatase superfamily)